MPLSLKCAVCEDTIGVYEPLVVLSDFDARRTSLAIDPSAADTADAVFHSACVPTLRISRPTLCCASSSHR